MDVHFSIGWDVSCDCAPCPRPHRRPRLTMGSPPGRHSRGADRCRRRRHAAATGSPRHPCDNTLLKSRHWLGALRRFVKQEQSAVACLCFGAICTERQVWRSAKRMQAGQPGRQHKADRPRCRMGGNSIVRGAGAQVAAPRSHSLPTGMSHANAAGNALQVGGGVVAGAGAQVAAAAGGGPRVGAPGARRRPQPSPQPPIQLHIAYGHTRSAPCRVVRHRVMSCRGSLA